jgi:serine/threonine protein kinase
MCDLGRTSTGMAEITRIGKFQVLGELGSGAHSSILHVRRSEDSKQYALKVVPVDGPEDNKFLEQAQHEFRVAGMLDHPSLIKIYVLESPRDWLFRIRKVHLLIEYVNGKTLDTFPRIPLPKLVQIFEKIAAGLVHMHRRGVYHADLKPNNVLLSRTGEVKVIDYGLAWIKGEPKERVQGTPEYIAPEQARHKMVNERTDIFNFGATMYRLVTFRNPPCMIDKDAGAGGPSEGLQIDAKTWRGLLKPVKGFQPDAPPKLCDLIHRCLEFNAVKRPERMSEIQGTLDHLAEELMRSPDDRLEAFEW